MAISGKTMQNICDKAYPIGSYYFSNDPTDPGILFGGTWDQITDCFIKAATSSISQSGGSRQKTISNFCPSHTHTVSNHTHSIPNHSHSGASVNHSHSIRSHFHSSGNQSHTHPLTKYIQAPSGTGVNTDDGTGAIYSGVTYAFNGVYTTFTFNTTTMQSEVGSGSAGSTSTSMDSLGSIGYTTTSLITTNISTESSGSNGSCTIDIIPPYRECYCWRRRA